MVHLLEDEHVQIAEVARNEVGHDLACAVGEQLIAARKALQDEMHVGWRVALPDQIFARPDLLGFADHLVQEALVGL